MNFFEMLKMLRMGDQPRSVAPSQEPSPIDWDEAGRNAFEAMRQYRRQRMLDWARQPQVMEPIRQFYREKGLLG